MSNEELFSQITNDIAAGRTEGLSSRIMDIAAGTEDPYDLLKCMSLLKLVPEDGSVSKLGCRIVGISDASNGLEIATALRTLDRPTLALDVLKKVPSDDRSVRLRCHCLYDIEEYESALELYDSIKNRCIDDRVLYSGILSAVGEHTRSIEASEKLLGEYPADYDVRIAYVSSLLLGGRDKDAVKYARAGLKDKSADSNAVAAYVLRVGGNIKAAGGYASRAVQLNHEHIGAMETLGICLALKDEYDKAKIVAGAINELSPGNKAAINILTYCEGH